MSRHLDVVVVGAGITGLAAAWEAHRQGAEVVVLDAGDRPGGKLRTSAVAGSPLDESADAFLARVPEAIGLCGELGIETNLVAPATGRAHVWIDGQLRPLPETQLLGVPTDLDGVAASGVLSPAGLARAREDLTRPDDRPVSDGSFPDESVGALVRRRLGDEVLDRLVAPLVGGIWAGDCDRLSLQTATPALAEARQRGPSLIRAAAEPRAAVAAAGTGADRPVFLAPRGGMVQLVDALADALGDRVRTDQPVERIERLMATADGRWRIQIAGAGDTGDAARAPAHRQVTGANSIVADAVVVATSAFAAAPLVAPHCRPAADALAAIDHASMVLVSLAVPRTGIEHPLDGSGFLVPPSEGRLLTTCSWTSSKWPHLVADQPDLALLRASASRDGDDRALYLDDRKLVDGLLADLAETMGLRGDPVDVRINRWWRSFPQPRPGHLARVAALETDLRRDAPGLTVAGGWARGVGIPACIRAGRAATLQALGASGR
jgi:oxygen-dependent protoporphyrinogen oxidase